MDFKKEIKASLVDSGFRHTRYRNFKEDFWKREDMEFTLAREEHFAFQMLVNYEHVECHYTVEKRDAISWRGLMDRVRIELEVEEGLAEYFNLRIVGYVENEEGTLVSDPILEDTELTAERGIPQLFWIDGKVPDDYRGEGFKIKLKIFTREGYEDERLEKELSVRVSVRDISMKDIEKSSEFFLDLWQHPSNWARTYQAELWSSEHFKVIGEQLRELASMGNKVITVIVSDYPWAGQHCYEDYKNPSNLFEYNMVRVKKKLSGNFECDFSAMDTYIDIAMSLGIDREIDLFGLMGIWDKGFGNPLEDYEDAVKISYLDEATGTFKYMKRKSELGQYVRLLFDHLEKQGYWERVRVMSDHPVDDRVLVESKRFIEGQAGNKSVKFKSAIYSKEVIEKHGGALDDASLSFALSLIMGEDLQKLKEELSLKGGRLTWYVCWFPEKPNNFISSPLIENRLIGWYTYYLGLDGFLRWDYAIWPTDPWNKPTYKLPYWKNGDMYFVYPGKKSRPLTSQRWENLRFGIQDFKIMKHLQAKGIEREEIEARFIEPLLGLKSHIEVHHERSLTLKYVDSYESYEASKVEMVDYLIKKS